MQVKQMLQPTPGKTSTGTVKARKLNHNTLFGSGINNMYIV